MVWDAARSRVVLFGGRSPAYLNDTWEWDGTIWTNKTPASNNPPPRHSHAMVYDVTRRVVVLFGGVVSGASGGDTWIWDGTAWSARTPAHSPGLLYNMGASWDPIAQRVIVFAGTAPFNSGRGYRNEVWEWDGADWSMRAVPGTLPTDRGSVQVAFNEARGTLLSFGGEDATTLFRGPIELTPTGWVDRAPASSSPQARVYGTLTYDPLRRRMVLFGGEDFISIFSGTWEWDGTNWFPQSPGAEPPASYGCAAVWDPVRQRVVLFGGDTSLTTTNHIRLNETWEYGP